jgi:DNA (cytosine-5)-methyltransferase 1
MKFLSCFSGIEAASAAWIPLGWQCVGVAEIEKFPCAVLKHHYPDVPNLGDVLADDFLDRVSALKPDVVIGGPPCQDFSIAGLRAGLDGHRGNLTLRWVQVIHAANARFSVTENVPGWLSVNGGHAFGSFLAGLVGADSTLVPPTQCGGRWTNAGMVAGRLGRCAWRILDAQYFGLAQRRKRVFVVFCPRNGDDPAKILFERKSMRGNTAPRRKTGEDVAGTFKARARSGGWGQDVDLAAGGYMQVVPSTSHCLNAGGMGRQDYETETLVAIPITTQMALRGEASNSVREGIGLGDAGDPAFTLQANHGHAVASKNTVRRLTPEECESLQGFLRGFTKITDKTADGPRYKALGNSMAVPVISWIGQRIKELMT